MLHTECGDLEIRVLEHLHSRVVAHGKCAWQGPEARGRDHRVAMVIHTVALVQAVGLQQSGDHLVNADRPEDRHRRLVAALHPALQHQFAQAVDVVGMEMGQEHGIDASGHEAHLADVARRARAGIEDQQPLAGDDQGAGARAPVVRERRARTAQPHVQAVGQCVQPVAGHVPCSDTLRHGQGQFGTPHPGQCTAQGQQDEKEPQDLAQLHGMAFRGSGHGQWPCVV